MLKIGFSKFSIKFYGLCFDLIKVVIPARIRAKFLIVCFHFKRLAALFAFRFCGCFFGKHDVCSPVCVTLIYINVRR